MNRFEKAHKKILKDKGKAVMTGEPVIRSLQKSIQKKSSFDIKHVDIKSFMAFPPADKVFAFQEDFKNGIPLGQLHIFSAGRSSGKTMFGSQLFQQFQAAEAARLAKPFKLLDAPALEVQRQHAYLSYGMFTSRRPTKDELDEMVTYCIETFGSWRKFPDGPERWACDTSGCFWFSTVTDQIVFKMRFS